MSGAHRPDLAAQPRPPSPSHQAGELAEAEQGYRAILAEQANHPDAWHNLGILALQVAARHRAGTAARRAASPTLSMVNSGSVIYRR